MNLAQISPGDLTNAHKDLEGISNCTKCHELGEAVLNSKCLDCHTEIDELIMQNRGYHALSSVKNKQCFDCHSEHHGRNFEIVRFDEKNFEHDLTGFYLRGKHSKIQCRDCHKSEFILNEKIKNSAEFIGLVSDCVLCHTDVHENTLSPSCENCHGFDSFKPASNFSHDKSNFKLTGKHKNLECIKCHTADQDKKLNLTKFTGIKFSQCSDCHTDIHKNKFGQNCSSCHVTASFKQIKNRSSFAHEKTNFPLIGKHKLVKCNDCHTANRGLKPAYTNCYDCHKDYHKGEFTTAASKRDCDECHTEQGFESTQFSIVEHNKTEFSLLGAHLAVPCSDCHYKKNNWSFRFSDLKCIQCHSNVHGNSISEKFLRENNCESCHVSESWNTISFEHTNTGFELLGKHDETACRECHFVEKDDGQEIHVFQGLNKSCENCHIDIHRSQFVENGEVNCLECHTNENWNPTKFNHDNANFKLDGSHKKVECAKCHYNIIEDDQTYINYKIGKTECAACHS
ncbi:MAG: cytochrome C [Ignavibacteriae bacterium]|nr:cytochrome C [Ignavibacteriota bacterium]NOG98695.1 cytochrome C [Ignavibacteriota bacterium]